MRKLFALYINEMIKLSRKISVVIILVITAALIVGACAIAKYNGGGMAEIRATQSAAYEQESADSDLKSYQSQLSEVQTKLKSASEADKASLEAQEADLKNKVAMYKAAADNGVSLTSGGSYLASTITNLYTLKAEAAGLRAIPEEYRTADMKTRLTRCDSDIALLQKALDGKNYSLYLEYVDGQTRSDTTLSSDEKNIKFASNALRLKYDPSGKATDNYLGLPTETAIQTIEVEKLSLLNGVDMANGMTPLTQDGRSKLANRLAVDSYRLEHGISSSTGTDYGKLAFQIMYGFGTVMLAMLMMILAGGSISSELSTGSIKSLIIAPVRRWKIFTAKLLSLITVMLTAGLFVYGVSTASFAAFFGMSTGKPYIYAVGGVVRVMSFPLYNFAYLYASLITVFVLMMFAYMLSIMTKNTAASVGISIGVYFGGSIVHSLLISLASGEWLKFLPFTNISPETKIFPDNTTSQIAASVTQANTSLTFSLVYIAVLVFLIGYIGFDSFTRQDIK